MSETLMNYILPFALGAVMIVLVLGIWNMMRGGNANRSQTLMRWRVGLQFVAICVAMVTLWLIGRS